MWTCWDGYSGVRDRKIKTLRPARLYKTVSQKPKELGVESCTDTLLQTIWLDLV